MDRICLWHVKGCKITMPFQRYRKPLSLLYSISISFLVRLFAIEPRVSSDGITLQSRRSQVSLGKRLPILKGRGHSISKPSYLACDTSVQPDWDEYHIQDKAYLPDWNWRSQIPPPRGMFIWSAPLEGFLESTPTSECLRFYRNSRLFQYSGRDWIRQGSIYKYMQM